MARKYVRRKSGNAGRVPPAVDGIQVNVCHNPMCSNFGVHPLGVVSKGRNPKLHDGYRLVGRKRTNDDLISQNLLCKICGESFILKSNLAILEELSRFQAPYITRSRICCTSQGCINSKVAVSEGPDCYQSFGKTTSGSLRYRCKACQRTFSVAQKASLRQRNPEKSEEIFKLLINKVPMRRICEIADIHPAVLYNRIDFIYKQCMAFAAGSERAFIEGMPIEKLRIAVDRQDHTFNWSSQSDRRNTKLTAIGSADCDSGYVFGFHMDYEPSLNPFEIDLHAREIGDYDLDFSFRKYARLFLPGDYDSPASIPDELEPLEAGTRLPSRGMRVHPEYTQIAHFYFLRWLLPNVKTLHFYLDREPGIRNACFSAFASKLKAGDLEAFFVRIDKAMTVDQKRLTLARSEVMFSNLQASLPDKSRYELAKALMKERYQLSMSMHPQVLDRWVASPFHHMGEPDKEICYISDRGPESNDIDAISGAMLSASLHPIDRFFMQIRRRVSLLERPIGTPSASNRMWYGYSSYNPEIAQKIMHIFRVAYNYHMAGDDGKTPAMRIGLKQNTFGLQEILDFINV